MMLIDCPFCGPRDETEFSCGGEAHIARPLAENKISDAEFADYLFMRDNPKGLFLERWRHSAGCRRWFNMARDTVSHEIVEIFVVDVFFDEANLDEGTENFLQLLIFIAGRLIRLLLVLEIVQELVHLPGVVVKVLLAAGMVRQGEGFCHEADC